MAGPETIAEVVMSAQFRCVGCKQMSGFSHLAEDRDVVMRLRDTAPDRDFTFYCERCGTANAVGLTPEVFAALMQRYMIR